MPVPWDKVIVSSKETPTLDESIVMVNDPVEVGAITPEAILLLASHVGNIVFEKLLFAIITTLSKPQFIL